MISTTRLAVLAATPVLALTVAAGPSAAAGHAGLHHAGMSAAEHAAMTAPAAKPTTAPAASATQTAATSHASMEHGAADAMFEVGSADRPLVTRPGTGPLWKGSTVNAPGMSSHGTLGSAVVGARLAARRETAEAEDLVATRARLSAAQATKKLSKRCQTLLKRKASKLSKKDRKRRSVCETQRKKLVAASQATESSTKTPTPSTGVSAPAAPVKGPDPTTAPPASTTTSEPSPTPTPIPSATGAPTPTPTPTPQPVAGSAEPVYGAVGVTATEGREKFRLTRATVVADIVNFELVNTDSQQHDLYIAAADENGEISGPPTKVIGRIDGQVSGRPTRSSIDMKLAPGRYKLICTVPGHGPMAVNFTVTAPAR